VIQTAKGIDRRLATWHCWLLFGLLVFTTNVPAGAEEKHDLQPVENTTGQLNGVADHVELETRFREQLSGSNLVGHFTDNAKPGGTLTPEKYTLGKIHKLQSDRWLFPVRIQYGNHDLTVPLALSVAWAGDTPIIKLDQLAIPGFGVFSARVLIHNDHYAGYWQGADHGGHLFGRIEHKQKSPDSSVK
jgi:hypothetical protein